MKALILGFAFLRFASLVMTLVLRPRLEGVSVAVYVTAIALTLALNLAIGAVVGYAILAVSAVAVAL